MGKRDLYKVIVSQRVRLLIENMQTDERRRHGLAEIWGREGGKGKILIRGLLGSQHIGHVGDMCVMERKIHWKGVKWKVRLTTGVGHKIGRAHV